MSIDHYIWIPELLQEGIIQVADISGRGMGKSLTDCDLLRQRSVRLLSDAVPALLFLPRLHAGQWKGSERKKMASRGKEVIVDCGEDMQKIPQRSFLTRYAGGEARQGTSPSEIAAY